MSISADLGVRGATTALAVGEVSALELVLSFLERITSERGRALNAFLHVAGDFACEQARESDRRRAAGNPRSSLDGVPIAIKDNIDIAGLPTTNGLATRWIPTADAPVARRFRDAGMVILGKLNMHEGALGATTDNRHHGRCAHPAFPGFTPLRRSHKSIAHLRSA
jgi:aspartyl-tRNA(Asn)/glutamyl-tRNA(Gln) amidotransferase subunit A